MNSDTPQPLLTQDQNLNDTGTDDELLASSELFLHRKGAAPTDKGPILIPGSRGAHSYLVLPTTATSKSAYSLAHGAGRRLARTAARVGDKAHHPDARELLITELQSRVVCDDKALLYEERPEAYKDAGCVISDLVENGLCGVVAVMRPVVTYKMRDVYRTS